MTRQMILNNEGVKMDAHCIAEKVIADWLCWDVGAILHPDEVKRLEERMIREIQKAIDAEKQYIH